MKTIGFIDYYLSEWHANNYPMWIKRASDEMGEDFEVKYAWAELDVSPLDNVSTDEWCEKNGVIKCESIEELCERADYILVLAPSNPEKHLGYAEVALTYKKQTYIDKTFAPDYKTAKKMFDIASGSGTKFFSTSALRYAAELSGFESTEAVITTGGGGNFEEYIIHQIEMAVKLLHAKPKLARTEDVSELQSVCTVTFEGGKSAVMVYASSLDFTVNANLDCRKNETRTVSSDFFGALISDILRFYLSGEASFDTAETLDVMKIREAVIAGKRTPGEWVEIN